MTQINKSRLRNMRNTPVQDIADFSANVKVQYTGIDDAVPAHKAWKQAITKLIRQGKPFRVTNTINGVTVVATGTRI